jgi:aldehyde:ferredoxin oxidoreductase
MRDPMKGGYAGRLLFADLTKGAIEAEALSEELARTFTGGYGLGARILCSMMKPRRV